MRIITQIRKGIRNPRKTTVTKAFGAALLVTSLALGSLALVHQLHFSSQIALASSGGGIVSGSAIVGAATFRHKLFDKNQEELVNYAQTTL